MNIILKEQIDNYRFAVAKIVFLLVKCRYKFISDIPNSNLMLVHDIETNENIYISILSQPTDRLFSKKITHVYYQKASYRRYQSTNNRRKVKNGNVEVFELSKNFDRLFREAIRMAFKNVNRLYKLFGSHNKFNNEFYNIINFYFEYAEKKICNDLKGKILYKYFSKDKVSCNRYQVNDGNLSFSQPRSFNDPFDSNCLLSNNEDMSERFRILCLTHKYNNILMWSYYSQNHEGYCFGYSVGNLIDSIKQISISGICIYGELYYTLTRPSQRSRRDQFSFSDMKFYIDATFTKYSEWSHEDECRFVILSEEHNEDYININVNIESIYEGCKGNNSPIFNSQEEQLETIQLSMDESEYKLNG